MRVRLSTVLSLTELAHAADEWRRDGAVIVLAAGCFDPLHLGHVQHLEAAKALGNVLVVAVASDRIIREYKSKPSLPRPFMSQDMRAGIVQGLRCVDAVIINDASCDVIYHLRPHIYAKGVEYNGNLTPDLESELKLLNRLGGNLEFVTGSVVCSSTAILAGMVTL